MDGVGVVVVVADGEILAGVEEEVASALADDDGAVDAGRPDDRAAEDLAQMVEQGVAAVLGCLGDGGVVVGAEGESVGAGDAAAQQDLDRLGDRPGVVVEVVAAGDGLVGRPTSP